jgi:cation diffusion facilitator family transporter
LSSGSKPAVIAALVGNLAIAVFKLIAALMSGSSAMLAEAYHSFSDTFNQVFLLVGIWRSKKPPDRLHPFGYGKEQFFWAFIVALMLFGIAGGLSIREAYHKFQHPEPLGDVTLGFIVLGVAFLVESIALLIALRQFRREMKSERFGHLVEGIQHTKDPAVLTVVFEDTLALVSIAVAFVCILLTVKTRNPLFDACGSLIIGILLMVFALILANENKKLLVGESVTPYRRRKVLEAIENIPEVNQVVRLRTLQMGPANAIVAAQVNLRDDLVTDQIETILDRMGAAIREVLPRAQCFIEVERKEHEMPVL